jgi:hypothetical protein
MKRLNLKAKVIVPIVVAILLVASALIFINLRHKSKCHDIIGDGYAMGTDPEPVVIGNTCE